MKSSSRWLGVVIGLQGLILLGQWTGGPRISTAEAQIVDPGAQRIAMIDELKKTNEKLDRIVNLLESGKLQVASPATDDKRDSQKGK